MPRALHKTACGKSDGFPITLSPRRYDLRYEKSSVLQDGADLLELCRYLFIRKNTTASTIIRTKQTAVSFFSTLSLLLDLFFPA